MSRKPPVHYKPPAMAKFDEAAELCGRLLSGLHYLEDREHDGRPVDESVCNELVRIIRRVNQSELLPAMVGYMLLRMSAEPGKEPPPSEDGDAELAAYRTVYYAVTRRLDEADNRARGPARH
ncbi:hypothetical protein AWB76_00198 [Caballeronia temeraria]|uniref:Uncharacterized protein n=1 Tax=Caballeronia temeraria TaxID=1777137 RepID=A0A157Z555_9BURK|nr:hypothetical protein [Caballeronia temeraria]SAK40688.1 hypothetical protein AWB76_00198 [Caballeronia temeraria]